MNIFTNTLQLLVIGGSIDMSKYSVSEQQIHGNPLEGTVVVPKIISLHFIPTETFNPVKNNTTN